MTRFNIVYSENLCEYKKPILYSHKRKDLCEYKKPINVEQNMFRVLELLWQIRLWKGRTVGVEGRGIREVGIKGRFLWLYRWRVLKGWVRQLGKTGSGAKLTWVPVGSCRGDTGVHGGDKIRLGEIFYRRLIEWIRKSQPFILFTLSFTKPLKLVFGRKRRGLLMT